MNACTWASCGMCGRCSHGQRGVRFECWRCGDPVFVGRDEPYPGPRVECERCQRRDEPMTTREDLTPRLYVPARKRALPDDYEPDDDALEERRR